MMSLRFPPLASAYVSTTSSHDLRLSKRPPHLPPLALSQRTVCPNGSDHGLAPSASTASDPSPQPPPRFLPTCASPPLPASFSAGSFSVIHSSTASGHENR